GPTWAHDFYRDPARSGGAFIDLHIHDADFIYWCFGRPRAVATTGTHQHLTTLYRFADPAGHAAPPAVSSPGTLSHVTPGPAPGASPPPRNTPLILPRDKDSEAIPLEPITGYEGEIRHLIRALS